MVCLMFAARRYPNVIVQQVLAIGLAALSHLDSRGQTSPPVLQPWPASRVNVMEGHSLTLEAQVQSDTPGLAAASVASIQNATIAFRACPGI